MDCARVGGTRAFGENGVAAGTFPELFRSKPDPALDGGGWRVAPIEFSRFGGAREAVTCLSSLAIGDGGTICVCRGMTSPDFDRCGRLRTTGGRCVDSSDLELPTGVSSKDADFGRRLGRSFSSIKEGSRELEELNPSDESDFLKSVFLLGRGNSSPDLDRPNFGGPDF
jgi:hypothetical protein